MVNIKTYSMEMSVLPLLLLLLLLLRDISFHHHNRAQQWQQQPTDHDHHPCKMFAREGEWSRVTRGAAADTEKLPWDETHTITTTTTTTTTQQRLQLWRRWCGVQRLAAVIIDNVCCSSIVLLLLWLAFHSANSS